VDLREGWIPVDTMLPKKLNSSNGTLTVHCTDGKNIYTGVYDHNWKIWSVVNMPTDVNIIPFSESITHWMPFPPLPQQD
jgi:hypothetical protein